ncbi:hypothetical protein FEMY_24090 [Ferrovum myxofaciens]|uniref:Lipoprotein n=1 Tax=Ferrovum myxofaciens TaxID=416213 RepID=A0A149VV21_9PROT|nr:DotD/TraH family lipoprotein [Ferrovum myxofaciens]KXW57073.1 hypothetical protein FEMY_24090 [Ferrovum myxofaciens]
MKLSGLGVLGTLLLLSGCSIFQKDDIPDPNVSNTASTNLKDVADAVYNELRQINAPAPVPRVNPESVHGCSTRLVSIDLDGDVMLLIDDMVKAKYCQVRVVGKKPPQDIVLSLHYKVKPLWTVLEDAGVQMGNLGSISVGENSVVFDFTPGVQK